MRGTARVSIWILGIVMLDRITCQADPTQEPSEPVFRIVDGEKMTFSNKKYCLKSITVKTYMSNDIFVKENAPGLRIQIEWESKYKMNTITVKSDSQNDSYCDSSNRFSFHRKPIKNHSHTFPDLVNYGSRYIPIKLDCKYEIKPEWVADCTPVRIKYSTPECLSENTCSCRNVSISGPQLKTRLRKSGITVLWEPPGETAVDISKIEKISLIFEPPPTAILHHQQDIIRKEFSINLTEDNSIQSYFFPLNASNATDYIIKGYFENSFGCPGNITHINIKFPAENSGSRHTYLYLMYYVMMLVILTPIIIFFVRREFGRLLCDKLFLRDNANRNQRLDRSIFPAPVLQEGISVTNPIYSSECPKEDLYEIDSRQLLLKKILGQGNFGVVYLATSQNEIRGYKVFAVKQLKSTASNEDVQDFLEEMETFKKAGAHPNIVRMIGYHKSDPPLSIVMEYVQFNLLTYLKNLRDEFDLKKTLRGERIGTDSSLSYSRESLPSYYISGAEVESIPLNKEREEALVYVLDHQELESFALQISRGMEHLERKNIVHRDLAARNILIDYHKNLKITDFGLSRMGVYVNKTDKKFPLRWMSPEAVTYRVFSNKSDVWSYGIVLWEIGTLGGCPYSELQNDEVLFLLRKGGHPDQPESITASLYDLMLKCWAFRPEDRPDFGDIVKEIESFRQKAYVDFINLVNCYVLPPTEEEFDKA